MNIIQNIDISILNFIQEHFTNTFLDKVMVFITSLGNAGAIWILIGILLTCSKKYRKYGFMTLIALAFCGLIGNLTLKPLVARARPFDTFPILKDLLIAAPKDFSFPSGHTMSSFAASTVIFYMDKKKGVAVILLSILIAFSRMYLYVHYPSDILAGMTIGIFMGMLSILICKKFLEKRNNK